MDMNSQFIKYMLACPQLNKLYSLFGEVSDAARHIIRLPDGIVYEKKYVDGSKSVQKYADWQINIFDSAVFCYQAPKNSENLSEYNQAQSICDWVQKQRIAQNYPVFDGVKAVDVECRPTNPQVAGVDENGIAKYTVGIRVTFAPEYVE